MTLTEPCFTVNDYLALNLPLNVCEAAIREKLSPEECSPISGLATIKQLQAIKTISVNKAKHKERRQKEEKREAEKLRREVTPEDLEEAEETAAAFAREYIFHHSPAEGVIIHYVRLRSDCYEVAMLNGSGEKVDSALSISFLHGKIAKEYKRYRDKYLKLIDYAANRKDSVLRAGDSVFLARVLDCISNLQINTLATPPIGVTNDPTEVSLCYFDLSLLKEGPTPTWDELLSRVNHPEHLLAFLYGVVYAKHSGRQVCSIVGGANTGKSSILKAMQSALGEKTCASLSARSLNDDKYLGHNILGKRFLVVGDCKAPRILSSETLHNITGEDLITSEQKYKDAQYFRPKATVMIMSNNPLKIDYTDNQMTRLLPFKMKSRKGNIDETGGRDEGWERKLCKEVWHALHRGKEIYERLSHNGHIFIGGVDFTENYDSSYFHFKKMTADYAKKEGAFTLCSELQTGLDKLCRKVKYAGQAEKVEENFNNYLKKIYGSETVMRADSQGIEDRYYTNLAITTDVCGGI
jgi:hypothetical protein